MKNTDGTAKPPRPPERRRRRRPRRDGRGPGTLGPRPAPGRDAKGSRDRDFKVKKDWEPNLEPQSFHSFDEVRDVLDQVLDASVADETEVVWFERRHGHAASGEPCRLESPRLSVMVRVVEGGRQGWYRTDTADSNLLESGTRQALALAKVRGKLKQVPVLPSASEPLRAPRELYDRELGHLEPTSAARLVDELCDEDERARLEWADVRLVIANSHGLRCSSASTEATLTVRSGKGPGAGYAAASARRLEELGPEAIRDRARELRGDGEVEVEALPEHPVPVLLSPEATIACLDLVNAYAFSGRSFLEGTSFLAKHRNVQVFDRKVGLRDDGTAPGLSFPFDFEGSRKLPLDLIVKGSPTTPALNRAQGAQAGLEPTAQSVGGGDALFSHLFLLPGDASGDALLAAADGGLRVGWIEATECWEPASLKIRGVARGVRRIEGARLGAAAPDFVWETSLLGTFARLRAVGDAPVVLATPTTPLGGISAPALVLEAASGFRAAAG